MFQKRIFQRKIIILFTAAAIVFFIGGFAAGFYFEKSRSSKNQNNIETRLDTAQEQAIQTDNTSAAGGQIQNIIGTVAKTDGSKITIKIGTQKPSADSSAELRVVDTDSNTLFYKYAAKDPAQYQKEMAEYNAKKRPVMPERFVRGDARLADIKIQDQIIVLAKEDVKGKQGLIASEVIITAPGQLMAP